MQALRSENERLAEEKAQAGSQAHGLMHALEDRLVRSQQRCQELQSRHSEGLAALKAEAKSRAEALQEQLAEASSERDFFMAQSSESASAAALAAQERDAVQTRLAEAQELTAAMQQVCTTIPLLPPAPVPQSNYCRHPANLFLVCSKWPMAAPRPAHVHNFMARLRAVP